VHTYKRIFKHTHAYTHSLSLSNTYAHIHALTRTHTHTHMHTHTHTLPHAPFSMRRAGNSNKTPCAPKITATTRSGKGGGGHGEFTTSLIREKQRSDSIVSLESLELLPVFPRRETDSRSCSPRRFSSGLDRVLQFVLQCMLQRVLHVCSSVWEQ